MKKLLKGDKEWLKARQQVITATEASSILGLNPYSSPVKMYEEKVNKTFVGNSYTMIGQFLEPVVVACTNYRLGTDFQIIENQIGKLFFQHDSMRLGATPDAIDGNQFLECKTTKPMNYLKYKYCPPITYLVQLQVQLICAGFDTGFLSIMSTDLSPVDQTLRLPLAIFKVTKSNRLEELLKQEVDRFWDCQKREVQFRVNSKVKKESGILVKMMKEHIRYNWKYNVWVEMDAIRYMIDYYKRELEDEDEDE